MGKRAYPEVEVTVDIERGYCSPAIAYWCKGHVSHEMFLGGLGLDHEKHCEPEALVHKYVRNVPFSEGGFIIHDSEPGRGAYPVTWLEADQATSIQCATTESY